jgi:hypothetical protein
MLESDTCDPSSTSTPGAVTEELEENDGWILLMVQNLRFRLRARWRILRPAV